MKYLLKRNRCISNSIITLILTCLYIVYLLYFNISSENQTKKIDSNFNNDYEYLVKQAAAASTDNDEYATMRKMFHDLNSKSNIRNKHFLNDLIEQEKLKKKYDPPKFFIILVQVHSRTNYLKVLIESLKQTEHIQDTLLIFSHDLYLKEINDLIESIDFCATLQIFYPYSLQIYKNKFPARDPNDCNANITKTK